MAVSFPEESSVEQKFTKISLKLKHQWIVFSKARAKQIKISKKKPNKRHKNTESVIAVT